MNDNIVGVVAAIIMAVSVITAFIVIIELQRMTKELQRGWLNLASRLYAVERYWNAHRQEMEMAGWSLESFERAVIDGRNPLAETNAFTEF